MEEGGAKGPRMSKRFNNGEVDYNNKAGTAWSHNFLNQKPWHPLSYPNQRRKWIAEQTHAQRELRSQEVAREFAQEQEFFRQTALVSEKEKEKMEMMKAVSFMYVRPPGYNAESAKAAESADMPKKDGEGNEQHDGTSTSMPQASKGQSRDEKKKSVPKDVFGRALPTEEQFEVLKNAPRLETGAPARPKPFAIEIRNVKCLRCGNFGHQSGDRECPLKDAIMPNEESRLHRDDPLTTIMAHAESSEPLKWELKQKPGMSPPRGGFDPDDPNQQIVAEDIFDEYGGFLAGESIPDLLANFTSSKPKKKSKSKKKHKSKYHEKEISSSDEDDDDDKRKSKKRRHKNKKRKHSEPSSSDEDNKFRNKDDEDDDKSRLRSRLKRKSNSKLDDRRDKSRHRRSYLSDDSRRGSPIGKKSRYNEGGVFSSDDDERRQYNEEKSKHFDYNDDEKMRLKSKKNDSGVKHRYNELNCSSRDGEYDKHRKRRSHRRSYAPDDSAFDDRGRSRYRQSSRNH